MQAIYAAMMGLIHDPAVFKCGISWAGITDIDKMFDHNWEGIASPRALAELNAMVGVPSQNAAQFAQTSPLQQSARITQPVLLAYGEDDVSVPLEHGLAFYKKLRATNTNVEWLTYAPSPEDRKTGSNRLDLWRHIETFLALQIGKQSGLASPGTN